MTRPLAIWTVSPGRLAWLAGSWVLVLAVSRLGLPKLDPSMMAVDRPMESYATLALVLPVALTTAMLPVRVPWLTVVAGRSLVPWRAGLAMGLLLVQMPVVVGVATAAHAPALQVVGTWLLLSAVAIGCLVWFGRSAAGLVPALLLVAFSQGSGLPPFAVNIVYNLALRPVLLGLVALLLPAGVIGYSLRGDR